MSVTRSDEGGIILSDAEQRAVVHVIAYNAITRGIEYGYENVPEMAENTWDAVADDLGLIADKHLERAYDIADAAGFDIDELMYALEGGG